MGCIGKVALVTGAAGGGMGRSTALTLAREGARVVVNYRSSRQAAEAVVGQIRAGGGDALAVGADIAREDGCRALVGAAVAQYGQVDICVVGPGGGWHPQPADRLAPEDGLSDLHAEVAPLYYLMPLLLPAMYERQWGRVVAIGLHPGHPSPAYAYNVAKAARAQALLLAKDQAWAHGVTVNVIAPGPVAALDGLPAAVEQCDQGAAWRQRTNVSPQDVAEGVAFLCSEAGRFITGCVLPYAFNR